MDSKVEALFRAMMNGGWFTKSDGDFESPYGYFGYVINEKADLFELYQTFEETITAYGKPDDDDVIGAFFMYINDSGIVHLKRCDNAAIAKSAFECELRDYNRWAESIETL